MVKIVLPEKKPIKINVIFLVQKISLVVFWANRKVYKGVHLWVYMGGNTEHTSEDSSESDTYEVMHCHMCNRKTEWCDNECLKCGVSFNTMIIYQRSHTQ